MAEKNTNSFKHEDAVVTGDLFVSNSSPALITKVTKKYLHHIFKGHPCRTTKEKFWFYVDTRDDFVLQYNMSKKKRKKQRSLRTLDLHGTAHSDAPEKVRQFFNFVELPCDVITGDSSRMRGIVETIASEYGWVCTRPDPLKHGKITVVERE